VTRVEREERAARLLDRQERCDEIDAARHQHGDDRVASDAFADEAPSQGIRAFQ
jgi:hypothetical protein